MKPIAIFVLVAASPWLPSRRQPRTRRRRATQTSALFQALPVLRLQPIHPSER